GTPIFFGITGANVGAHMVRADAAGQAVFNYTGIKTGDDIVTASAAAGAQTVISNPARVTWTPGMHTSDVNLNLTPGGASRKRLTTLVAGVFDLSGDDAPIVGAAVHFTLGAQ